MKISTTADRLKQLMKENNLRQIDILQKASYYCSKYDTKITKADLSQYVSGKVEPGQAKLFVLSNALNVNEAWLMGYDVPKTRNSIIQTNHCKINDNIINAVQILASQSGYKIDFTANQWKIYFNNCIINISPTELDDLINSSCKQIAFVIQSFINNRLKDNSFPINTDLLINDTKENDKDIIPYDSIPDTPEELERLYPTVDINEWKKKNKN